MGVRFLDFNENWFGFKGMLQHRKGIQLLIDYFVELQR